MALIDTQSNLGPRPSGIYAAGRNQSAQFDFTTQNIDILRALTTISSSGGIRSVAPGFGQHTLYLLNNGKILSIGSNSTGQCGQSGVVDPSSLGYMIYDQDNNTQLTSVKIFNSGVAISAGSFHSLVLDSSGTVWACGEGTAGKLGIGTTSQREWLVPSFSGLNFGGGFRITAISAGSNFSLALDQFGRLWTCGNNTNNQQGHAGGNQVEWRLNTELSGAYPVSIISAGNTNSYIVTSVSGLMAAGSNTNGELGIGNTDPQTIFRQVTELNGVTVRKIATGTSHAHALTSDGKVYSWGLGTNGSLGVGDTSTYSTPRLISGIIPNRVIDIAAGASNGYALGSANDLYAWGDDTYGQLGNGGGAGSSQLSPIIMTSGSKFDFLHIGRSASDVYAVTASSYDSSPTLYIFGVQPQSGYCNLMISGVGYISSSITLTFPGSMSSSGMPLFEYGYEISSGIHTLHTKGSISNSGSCNLFMKGMVSGAIPLFIYGKLASSINLYETGHLTASGNISLNTKGAEIENFIGFVKSYSNPQDDISLYIKGTTSQSSIYQFNTTTLYIGNDGSTNNFGTDFRGFIEVSGGSYFNGFNNNYYGFIRGGNYSAKSFNIFIKGHTGSTPNGIGFSGSINAFIIGLGDSNSFGFIPYDSDSYGFIRVKQGAINSFSLYLHNTFTENDIDCYLFGISGSLIQTRVLFIGGKSPIINTVNLYEKGIIGAISGYIPIKMVGYASGLMNRNMTLYSHGF